MTSYVPAVLAGLLVGSPSFFPPSHLPSFFPPSHLSSFFPPSRPPSVPSSFPFPFFFLPPCLPAFSFPTWSQHLHLPWPLVSDPRAVPVHSDALQLCMEWLHWSIGDISEPSTSLGPWQTRHTWSSAVTSPRLHPVLPSRGGRRAGHWTVQRPLFPVHFRHLRSHAVSRIRGTSGWSTAVCPDYVLEKILGKEFLCVSGDWSEDEIFRIAPQSVVPGHWHPGVVPAALTSLGIPLDMQNSTALPDSLNRNQHFKEIPGNLYTCHHVRDIVSENDGQKQKTWSEHTLIQM